VDTLILQLLLFGFLAGAANVLGGLILFPDKIRKDYKGMLRYLLALGAGFMLAVTFFEVIPNSIQLWQSSTSAGAENGLYLPMLLILGGYLLTQFFEHTIAPHFHLGEEVHSDHKVISTRSAYTGIGGFLIHTFFDGVMIASASAISINIGFLVFIAVFLHKFPEGFTIGSMVLAAGKGRREVVIATGIVGATTLVGVIVFHLIGSYIGFSVAYALPIAAGVTLYVAASDLIPEINHHGGKSPFVSLSVFAGVGLFFLIHYGVHELGAH
jgi:zinc transporter ZupT